jgi:energy-coupling factor transporter ATP-binding protein EcfA2
MEQNGTTICTKPLIIGFSGKIGCGKSTVCAIVERLLKERMGLKVETISFGTILKQKVAEAFRFPLDCCYSTEGKSKYVKFTQDHYVLEETHVTQEFVSYKKQLSIIPHIKGMTVRQLLQWWGTEVARRHDPHYWVKAWKQTARRSNADVILVDDVRFPNEVYAIRGGDSFGGVFRLNPYEGWDYASNHESETALDNYAFGEYWTLSPERGLAFLQALAWSIFHDIHTQGLQARITAMREQEGIYGFEI